MLLERPAHSVLSVKNMRAKGMTFLYPRMVEGISRIATHTQLLPDPP
jgi:hypothetical protein